MGDVGSNHGEIDSWVVKLSSDGIKVWQNTLGGEGYEEAYTIAATPDGGCVLGGYTDSDNTGDVGPTQGDYDYWILKLNNNGQKLWQKTIGGLESEEAYGIAVAPDGSYWITGTAYTQNRDNDFWVVKMKDH